MGKVVITVGRIALSIAVYCVLRRAASQELGRVLYLGGSLFSARAATNLANVAGTIETVDTFTGALS